MVQNNKKQRKKPTAKPKTKAKTTQKAKSKPRRPIGSVGFPAHRRRLSGDPPPLLNQPSIGSMRKKMNQLKNYS